MRKHLGMFWLSEQFAPYFAVLKKAFLPKGEEQCGLFLAAGWILTWAQRRLRKVC